MMGGPMILALLLSPAWAQTPGPPTPIILDRVDIRSTPQAPALGLVLARAPVRPPPTPALEANMLARLAATQDAKVLQD